MTCPTHDILSQLVDGELSGEQLAMVRGHLKDCPACAEQVRTIQAIGNAVRAAPLPVAPQAMLDRLAGRAIRLPDRAVRRAATWMTAAATLVLVVSALNVTSPTARATASLADWEQVALAPEDDSATREQATARWIAADLSRMNSSTGETP